MRLGLLTLMLALVGVLTAGSLAVSARGLKTCGTERWSVKTLTDASAANIDLTLVHATSTTVEKLRHLKAPAVTKSSPRFPGVEGSTYRVTALLMSLRRESDSDIHLVIADPKIGGSMIVEFPAAACLTGASAKAQQLMGDALQALTSACRALPPNGSEAVHTLQGKATITGVGFFDLIHGQGGVAPNGIELHPALAFQSTSCHVVSP